MLTQNDAGRGISAGGYPEKRVPLAILGAGDGLLFPGD